MILFIWLLLSMQAFAQETDLQRQARKEKPIKETRFALSIENEVSGVAGLGADLPSGSNLLIAQPAFTYRQGQRLRFSTSLACLVSTYDETHASLRVKETYLSVSLGDLEATAGKKIMRWGTGYAFTPTGVLDPPLNPANPTDRLNLNEGREMITVNWIGGRHSVTAAWASAGLVQQHHVGMLETAAIRYNARIGGFDGSLIYSHDRGGANIAGANFTHVIGRAIEIHGECARRRGSEFVYIPGFSEPLLLPEGTKTAVLLGGKYTHSSGIGTILEFYSSNGLPAIHGASSPNPNGTGLVTERRSYAFLRIGKSRLRERPGWKEWDLSGIVLVNLSDASHMLVIDFARRFGNRVTLHGNTTAPGGKRGQSEYAMIPYAARVSIGIRVQI